MGLAGQTRIINFVKDHPYPNEQLFLPDKMQLYVYYEVKWGSYSALHSYQLLRSQHSMQDYMYTCI